MHMYGKQLWMILPVQSDLCGWCLPDKLIYKEYLIYPLYRTQPYSPFARCTQWIPTTLGPWRKYYGVARGGELYLRRMAGVCYVHYSTCQLPEYLICVIRAILLPWIRATPYTLQPQRTHGTSARVNAKLTAPPPPHPPQGMCHAVLHQGYVPHPPYRIRDTPYPTQG